jgi:ribosomal protein L11 methyltransferase
MKHRAIWRIAIITTAEAEDAVAELLSSVFNERASAYTDSETGVTTVAVYCETKPPHLAAKRAALRAGMSRIKDCRLNIGAGRISVRRIRREDWAESWKRHFKPIEIGRALLVKPSWSGRRARKHQAVVVLDPGLSFGTGQHPTTAFCLHELARRRRAGEAQSFLDIGTGSGILAIAAAKLGYSPVHAFDFDPEAVRVARANAKANRVLDKVQIERADVTKLPTRFARQYHLVCANLISTLLIGEQRRIVRLLRPGGVLVLAGILKSEFAQIQRAYETLGLRAIVNRCEREWRSGSFAFAG